MEVESSSSEHTLVRSSACDLSNALAIMNGIKPIQKPLGWEKNAPAYELNAETIQRLINEMDAEITGEP